MDALNTSMVEFKANGGTAPGYLARPTGEGPFPGVVVIQEWWGLNDQIKSVADRLAQQGFAALAPDLYRGQVAGEPDEARKLSMEMNREQAIKDIQGAVNYLIEQPFVEPKKIGVIGFCMGGGLAAMISYRGENVGAVVVFYGGRGMPDEEAVREMSAPFLGLYGAEDKSIPPEMVRDWDLLMTEHNKVHDMVIYEGAGHAFFNDQRPAYRPEAAEDAWRRTLAWLRQWLQPSRNLEGAG